MGRMSGILGLRMLKAFERLGWTESHVRGSHHYLRSPSGQLISVPVHKGRTMKQGTARAILAQAGLTEDEFFEAY